MRVLFLAYEPPFPPNDGGRIRTYNLMRQVAARHQVEMVAFGHAEMAEDALAALEAFGVTLWTVARPDRGQRSIADKVRGLVARDPVALTRFSCVSMERTIRAVIARFRPDVVHVDQVYLAQYRSCFPNLPATETHHNVEAEGQRRLLAARSDRGSPAWLAAWLEYRRWRAYELRASATMDSLAVVSERDAAYFRRRVPEVPVVVVPNGVDTARFRPSSASGAEQVVVFAGRMDYEPNVDGAVWMARQVWPAVRDRFPRAELRIVGRNPVLAVRALGDLPGVSVTGEVTDLRSQYAEALVAVVPLRLGSGTRLKVLEAMAAGTPVVSTKIGIEGLDLEPGADVLVADAAKAFADGVCLLLDAPDLRSTIAAAARETVVRRFDWSTIVEAQEHAYEIAVRRRVGPITA